MENKISMALKDFILQQGIENICKENAELKTICQDLSDKFDYQVKQVMILEKENAELKARVENQKSFLKRIKAKFELGKIDRKEIEGYLESDQLTKAKEIIRGFVEWANWQGSNCPSFKSIQDKAEQFLKEIKA